MISICDVISYPMTEIMSALSSSVKPYIGEKMEKLHLLKELFCLSNIAVWLQFKQVDVIKLQ